MPLFPPPLTVTSDTNGHLTSSATGTPTLTSVHANVINQSVSGNDSRGTISFDVQTGTITSGGNLFTVTFANAYGSTPIVVLTTGPSNQSTSNFYVSADGTGTFTVRNTASLSVLTGYKLQYWVI